MPTDLGELKVFSFTRPNKTVIIVAKAKEALK
jgi:hypothetical protein